VASSTPSLCLFHSNQRKELPKPIYFELLYCVDKLAYCKTAIENLRLTLREKEKEKRKKTKTRIDKRRDKKK